MNHLLRSKAPIGDEAWAAVDAEASRALRTYLAARRLIDFRGPLGWECSALPLGRLGASEQLRGGAVELRTRRVRPLVELRTPFRLRRDELDAVARGACDADLGPVVTAARDAAAAEDQMVFHGLPDHGVAGLSEASPHDKVMLSSDYAAYPGQVAQAIASLREAGVEGPWAVALGPRCYAGVMRETEGGGYPVLSHLRLVLEGGEVVHAPAIDGAVVLSRRGGDFEMVCGQDLAVGYLDHDAEEVELYLEETLAVQICTPEAAVHLADPG